MGNRDQDRLGRGRDTLPPEGQRGLCRWLGAFLGCRPPSPEVGRRRVGNRRTHLANERTFLAWLRTALGLMAFGFVVHRFNLLARELRLLAGAAPARLPGGFPHLGLALIVAGSALGVLAAARFLIVEREIETDTYAPSVILNISLALVLAAMGLFLAVTLWES